MVRFRLKVEFKDVIVLIFKCQGQTHFILKVRNERIFLWNMRDGTGHFFIYIYVYMYMNIYVCVCVYICTYVYLYICMCVYMCICVYMYICICICVYVCVYTMELLPTQCMGALDLLRGEIWFFFVCWLSSEYFLHITQNLELTQHITLSLLM